jgi:hypothetical protein
MYPRRSKQEECSPSLQYSITAILGLQHSHRIPTNRNSRKTYVTGDRLRGYPLGSWTGTDAVDYFVRSSRYLTDTLQLGVNLDLWEERARGQPVHEKGKSGGTDLTWWISPWIQSTLAYTYQRIENPGQITSVNPFAETFQSGVTSHNHFIWTNLAVSF